MNTAAMPRNGRLAIQERLCAECGTNPVPRGRRKFCSKECYRRGNSRQNSVIKRERNQKKRELVDIIDRAVRDLQCLDPYYGRSAVTDWSLRFTWKGWSGQGYYDHVQMPKLRAGKFPEEV